MTAEVHGQEGSHDAWKRVDIVHDADALRLPAGCAVAPGAPAPRYSLLALRGSPKARLMQLSRKPGRRRAARCYAAAEAAAAQPPSL